MVDCESRYIHYLDIKPVNKRALWSLVEPCGALWSICCQSELQGLWRRDGRDGSLALDWLTFLINITLGFLYTNYIQRYTILTNARMHFKRSHLTSEWELSQFLWWGLDFNERIKALYILNLSCDLALSIKFQLNDINLNPGCMWNYYKLNTEGLQNNEEIIRDSAVRTFDKATPHPTPGLSEGGAVSSSSPSWGWTSGVFMCWALITLLISSPDVIGQS